MKQDLINLDISRCNDYKCPTAPFCARYRQVNIDSENGIKAVSVTDFKGHQKKGLCDFFLNANVIESENKE